MLIDGWNIDSATIAWSHGITVDELQTFDEGSHTHTGYVIANCQSVPAVVGSGQSRWMLVDVSAALALLLIAPKATVD